MYYKKQRSKKRRSFDVRETPVDVQQQLDVGSCHIPYVILS